MGAVRTWLKEAIPPILVVLLLDLAITAALILVSGKAVKIGTFRPAQTVPPKLVELGAVGLAVGAVATLARGRLDPTLLTLGVAFVALIDADHLPSLFKVAQPIRPAHTVAFLALEAGVLYVAFPRKGEVPLMAVAAFFGHLAGDTGVFAPLAPLSFDYTSLSAYDLPMAVGAVAFAVAAGYVRRRRLGGLLAANMKPG